MSRGRRTARREKQLQAEARRRAQARRRRWIGGGIGAAAVALVAVIVLTSGGSSEGLTGDTTAQAWDLPELEGDGRVALADFAGKPTVAVFFASWCEVCEREIPGFVTLADQLGDRVNWVGINSQDDGRGLGDARKWGIDAWPLARDIGGANGSDLSTATFAMRGMPLTVVYDEGGTVVHIQRGGISASDLLDILQSFDLA